MVYDVVSSSPEVTGLISISGAKYLQIVTSLGALDSAEDLNRLDYRLG
jgi:hypothetical protein